MSSRRGLPDYRKMRHDRHFVEELANNSQAGFGILVPVDRIETNREQPRSNLGDLGELAASIKSRGVLEPLLVRQIAPNGLYQLIAGERRFHAAIEAGLAEVPCIELQVTDQEALELALVENLQRKDLSPFEEGEGYRTLVEKYGYSHEEAASAVAKSRTSITEALKLLAIPPAIRDLCRHADITAKSVLLLIARAESIDEMERLVQEIAEGNLDREGARAAAREGPEPGSSNSATDLDERPHQRFHPINIRFAVERSSPIRFAMSIRKPGVTRAELVAMIERVLDSVRRGELDPQLEHHNSPSH